MLSARAINFDTSHQQVVDDETKAEEIKKHHALNNQPLDYNTASVRTIWPFLRPEEAIPTDEQLKTRGYELIIELQDELKKAMASNDARAAKVQGKEAPAQTPYVPSDSTVQSLSILEEFPCDFEDWEETCKTDIWATRILKIWFTIERDFAIIHKWAKFPDCLNDEAFRSKAIPQVEDIIEELDTYLQEKITDANLDEMSTEKLAHLEILINHLGGVE